MDKYIFDESNGLWYELQGDYYIPCLTLPTEKEHKPIGLWGQRHKRYLQEHKRAVYTTLLTSGKLNEYLADVDKQAEECFERLVEQMKQSQDITEQLKSENALEWVQKMNNIRACAIEVINNERDNLRITILEAGHFLPLYYLLTLLEGLDIIVILLIVIYRRSVWII